MSYKYKGGYIAISKDPAAGIQRLKDLRDYYDGMTFGTYQKHFHKIVLPEYIAKLKEHGEFEARKISRTGDLQKHIVTGRGKATRGFPSVWLGADGAPGKYASIINSGGWQTTENYMTVPLDAAKDKKTGAKRKSVWEYDESRTFLFTPTSPTWGRLVGQLVLFWKERKLPPQGRQKGRAGKPIFKRGNKTPGTHFDKITPLFIYTKKNYVNATHWADNAMARSKQDAIKMIREYNINFAKRGKRGVMSR